MELTKQIINANFKIKVNGIVEGKKINSLFGVSGVIRLMEQTKKYDQCQAELFNSIVEKAFNSTTDKYQYKLRRGLKIVLYRF